MDSNGTYYPYPGTGSAIVSLIDPSLSGSDYGTAGTSGGMYLVSDINIQSGLGAVDYNFLSEPFSQTRSRSVCS